MNIIQILGPSYSGTTALGYALNTGKGCFFGSEVRRILPAQIALLKSLPVCDFCGESCRYWTKDLFEEIKQSNATSLNDVYRIFSVKNPDIHIFIDASKTISSTKGTKADHRVLSLKHPLRLLASTLYNIESKSKNGRFNFQDFFLFAEANHQDILDKSSTHLKTIGNKYVEYRNAFREAVVFKCDEAHLDNFFSFSKLVEALEIPKPVFPQYFSGTPCHSLGGNRAPTWLQNARKDSREINNARFKYYSDRTEFGDWKLDNKFEKLFSEDLQAKIISLSEYQSLCDALEYPDFPRKVFS